MKSKELKAHNLPDDRVVVSEINAKPTPLFFVLFLLGIASLFFRNYVFGISFIGLSMVLFLFLPDRVLIEFYKEYFVLFNHADKNDCELLYYEDVVNWTYRSGFKYDYLQISLTDGSTHSVEGFSRFLTEAQMNRFLKDKRLKTKK